MPAVLCLVRHGAYALMDRALGGRGDHALSDEGRAQAKRVAAALDGHGVAAVVSSPVWRARETAEIIAGRLGLPVRLDPAFAEIDYGDWTGRRFDELDGDPAWEAWNRFRGTAGVPGGETMLTVQARAMAGLVRLAAEYRDGEVVVVSHADVIKAMLAHVLGTPLDLMGRMEIGAASLSRVVLYPRDARVVGINVPP
ncbi:MAG: histidine phosphatase family protein [Gammaproteobacteria bacterium]